MITTASIFKNKQRGKLLKWFLLFSRFSGDKKLSQFLLFFIAVDCCSAWFVFSHIYRLITCVISLFSERVRVTLRPFLCLINDTILAWKWRWPSRKISLGCRPIISKILPWKFSFRLKNCNKRRCWNFFTFLLLLLIKPNTKVDLNHGKNFRPTSTKKLFQYFPFFFFTFALLLNIYRTFFLRTRKNPEKEKPISTLHLLLLLLFIIAFKLTIII